MGDIEGMWMTWGRITSIRATSHDRQQIRAYASAKASATHLAGITSAGVDRMWIAMYESNQRSKNYNKKILRLDLEGSQEASTR
jgi:hypothetical protein